MYKRQVVFGVRPEHLSLGDDGLEVQVSALESTGADTVVYLSLIHI